MQSTKVIELHRQAYAELDQLVASVKLRVRIDLGISNHVGAMFTHCAQHILLRTRTDPDHAWLLKSSLILEATRKEHLVRCVSSD